MRFGCRIAVVVPAYNEQERLGGTLRSIPNWVDHIVVVDDGSHDRTAQVGAAGPRRVELIQHGDNRGVGAALSTGYRVAFDRGADIAAVMAGDGQMDPSDLDALIEPVATDGVDYVVGNRLRHRACVFAMPVERRIGSRILAWLTRLATGLSIEDSQCGYTAMHRRAARFLELGSLWPGYGYPNDLLVRVARRSLSFRHVVVRPVYQGEGSGIRWWHGVFVIPFIILRARLLHASILLKPLSIMNRESSGKRNVRPCE